ncbi:MAG TPA: NINE protein, partial [Allocoleopsis sp.]
EVCHPDVMSTQLTPQNRAPQNWTPQNRSLKDRKVAALLAFVGVVIPGLHKFYLGQPRWGIVYLLLFLTPISKIASLLEGIWYLFQDREEFDRLFNYPLPSSLSLTGTGALMPGSISAAVVELPPVGAVADALRQLDALRQEGLISEYEFEQKRRQLLDRMG